MSSSVPNSLIGSVPSSWTIRISALEAHALATSSIATLSISVPVPVPPYSSLERQPEQVLLGEQLADVPRVLGLGVDLRRARRDPLAHDLADRVAEVELLRRSARTCQRARSSMIRRRVFAAGLPDRRIRVAPVHGHSEPHIFLIAVGAILRFAVNATASPASTSPTVGLILMIVGVIGLADLAALHDHVVARPHACRRHDRPVARDREYY